MNDGNNYFSPESEFSFTGGNPRGNVRFSLSLIGKELDMDEMTITEAADYLDWLESHGEETKEIILMEDGKVIVR